MIPVVAHSVNPYLPNSGSWIYHQIRFLESFRPIVLTKRTENLDQFPIAPHLQRLRAAVSAQEPGESDRPG